MIPPAPPYCALDGRPLADGGHDRCASALELEPPRYCSACRRRMVVQVVPTGWTARCVEHGVLSAGLTPPGPGGAAPR